MSSTIPTGQDFINDLSRKNRELRAELERLREALRPFAMQNIEGMISFDELTLDREDFLRARAALEQKADTE